LLLYRSSSYAAYVMTPVIPPPPPIYKATVRSFDASMKRTQQHDDDDASPYESPARRRHKQGGDDSTHGLPPSGTSRATTGPIDIPTRSTFGGSPLAASTPRKSSLTSWPGTPKSGGTGLGSAGWWYSTRRAAGINPGPSGHAQDGQPPIPNVDAHRNTPMDTSEGGGAVGDAQAGQQFKRGPIEEHQTIRHKRHHGGDASGHGSGASGVAAQVPPMLRSDQSSKFTSQTINNKWIIRSFGFAWSQKERSAEDTVQGQVKKHGRIKSTSMVMLPVMHTSFYMSPSEYHNL